MNPLKHFALGTLMSLWVVTASADTTNYNFTLNPDLTVPDGNMSGLAFTTNLSGMLGIITDVTLTLDITGGYNGDLYAYLAGPHGGFAVLLNRAGVTDGNGIGYGDSGFHVTFNDSGSFTNIHFYQDYIHNLDANNALLGTWSSDGRAIDPLSAGSVFSTNVPSAFLESFNGTDPNGNWTLFLADLSNGGESTVTSWTLEVTTVPEPTTFSLVGIGVVILLARKRMSRST